MAHVHGVQLSCAAVTADSMLCHTKFATYCSVGGKTDESGVPLNPVRGGLPMAGDELAAFKLVGAALLMAYVEVRVHLIRPYGLSKFVKVEGHWKEPWC
jgi:hypothetical protein